MAFVSRRNPLPFITKSPLFLDSITIPMQFPHQIGKVVLLLIFFYRNDNNPACEGRIFFRHLKRDPISLGAHYFLNDWHNGVLPFTENSIPKLSHFVGCNVAPSALSASPHLCVRSPTHLPRYPPPTSRATHHVPREVHTM